MAVENAFIQALTYNAEVTRRAVYGLLQRGSTVGSVLGGLVGSGDCQTVAGTGMNVEVAPGEVIVPGSSSGSQSGYYCRNTATATLAIAASDPSNPRIDRISAVIKDAAYAGGENTGQLAVVTGTPTSGATLSNLSGVGAAPTSSLTLAYLLVPAKAASLSNGNIGNVAALATYGLPLWRTVSTAVGVTMASNTLYEVTAAGQTMTLPASAATGASFIVYAAGGTTTVTAGSGGIYGDFSAGVSSVTLATQQHVWVARKSDGNWVIVAGETKREQTYSTVFMTEAESKTGAIPSTSRPALVNLEVVGVAAKELTVQAEVGSEAAGGVQGVNGSNKFIGTISLFVPPGVRWKVLSASNIEEVRVRTILQ